MSKCDESKCEMNERIESLEQIVRGSGKGGDNGLVGDIAELKLYAKAILFVVGIGTIAIVSYVALNLAKAGMGIPVQQQQSISVAPDGTAPPTAEYTVKELAAKLGYSEREIQDRALKGEIPGARKDGKAWRFDRGAIDAAFAAKAASAAKAAGAAP